MIASVPAAVLTSQPLEIIPNAMAATLRPDTPIRLMNTVLAGVGSLPYCAMAFSGARVETVPCTRGEAMAAFATSDASRV